MPEWSKGLVLKTSEGKTSGGSNPSRSAKLEEFDRDGVFSQQARELSAEEEVAIRLRGIPEDSAMMGIACPDCGSELFRRGRNKWESFDSDPPLMELGCVCGYATFAYYKLKKRE